MSAVVRCKFRPRRRVKQESSVGDVPVATERPISRIARMLALAHHIERLVDTGELESVAAASRALGLTRGRLTQLMNLLLLAPEIQKRILVGGDDRSERFLRTVVREPDWRRQHDIQGRIAQVPRETTLRRAVAGGSRE